MEIILINDSIKIEQNDECALCLGVFDGVHRGHRSLIEKTVCVAEKKGIKAAALTFLSKFEKDKIYPLETRIKLMKKCGIEKLYVVDFTKRFKNLSPTEFVDEYIVNYLKAKEVICGFDYRFGKGAKGDTKTLYDLSEGRYNLTVMPPVTIMGETVSSTLIRKCLKEGNIKKANIMLGSPYEFEGTVRKGRQIGRTINFPTANVMLKYENIPIKCGVYASQVCYDNKKYYGITNIGCAPTVRNSNVIITETHIMDFCEDIYNKNLTIELIDFIRDEKKFRDISELKEVIEDNIKTAVKILEDL